MFGKMTYAKRRKEEKAADDRARLRRIGRMAPPVHVYPKVKRPGKLVPYKRAFKPQT